MRHALNEVVADRRFLVRKPAITLDVAEHTFGRRLWARDLNGLKSSEFDKPSGAA
jgi:hypothetical protein